MGKLVVSVVIGLLCWQTASPDTSKPFVEPATGITFPLALGNWKRGNDRDYGPEGGVSIAYHSGSGATATIFVYNQGLKAIPTGMASQLLKNAFADTKSEIEEAMQQRGGSAKLLSEGEAALGAGGKSLKTLRACFAIVYQDNFEELSDAYLTGYKNQFLKLRLTYPKEDRAVHEAEIKSLTSDLSDLLGK